MFLIVYFPFFFSDKKSSPFRFCMYKIAVTNCFLSVPWIYSDVDKNENDLKVTFTGFVREETKQRWAKYKLDLITGTFFSNSWPERTIIITSNNEKGQHNKQSDMITYKKKKKENECKARQTQVASSWQSGKPLSNSTSCLYHDNLS